MSGSLREEWEECCAERDREKARADAAEALYADSETARMVARNAELTNALAAARRECEGLRKAVSGLIAACEFGGGCDGSDPDTCDGCVAVDEAKAALAAPAAGEEGKR